MKGIYNARNCDIAYCSLSYDLALFITLVFYMSQTNSLILQHSNILAILSKYGLVV